MLLLCNSFKKVKFQDNHKKQPPLRKFNFASYRIYFAFPLTLLANAPEKRTVMDFVPTLI